MFWRGVIFIFELHYPTDFLPITILGLSEKCFFPQTLSFFILLSTYKKRSSQDKISEWLLHENPMLTVFPLNCARACVCVCTKVARLAHKEKWSTHFPKKILIVFIHIKMMPYDSAFTWSCNGSILLLTSGLEYGWNALYLMFWGKHAVPNININ